MRCEYCCWCCLLCFYLSDPEHKTDFETVFVEASVLGSVCALLLLLREPACRADEVTSNTGR